MNICLKGWRESVVDDLDGVGRKIREIREDFKQDVFEELEEAHTTAKKRAIGFMEDMNNIFAGLNELKTEKEKAQWVDNIKDLLGTQALTYKETERTLLRKK